jgi:hypothetical protein
VHFKSKETKKNPRRKRKAQGHTSPLFAAAQKPLLAMGPPVKNFAAAANPSPAPACPGPGPCPALAAAAHPTAAAATNPGPAPCPALAAAKPSAVDAAATKPKPVKSSLAAAAAASAAPRQNVFLSSPATSLVPYTPQEKFVFESSFDIESPLKPMLDKDRLELVPKTGKGCRTPGKQLATNKILLRIERQNKWSDRAEKKKEQRLREMRNGYEIKGDSPDTAKVFSSLDEMMAAAGEQLAYNPSEI